METYKLSDQQIEALQKAFDEFDINNDGTITPKEILGILKSHDLYKTQDDISEFVTKYDIDGDQKITFEEYLTIFKKQLQWKELKDNAFDLFCEFAENGDGN